MSSCYVQRWYKANTTSKPTPICIHFSLYGYKTYRLDAISHTSKGMWINTSREHLPLLCSLTVHEVCEVSESQEQSAKYAPFPLCRDPYSESSANKCLKEQNFLAKNPHWGIKIIKFLPFWGIFLYLTTLCEIFIVLLHPCLEKQQIKQKSKRYGRKE